MIAESDFASIRSLVEQMLGKKGEPFVLGKVIKRDEGKRLIWIAELGDQPIPIVSFNDSAYVFVEKNTPENWHYVGDAGEPIFNNNWVNYQSGGPWSRLAFKKDPFNFVHIRGTVRDGTLNTQIFQLPAIYYPFEYERFPITMNVAFGYCDVYTNGTVYIFGASNAAGTLSGITFESVNPVIPGKKLERAEIISSPQVPKIGDNVLVAQELGTRRLPRCLGVIQSIEYT